MFGNDPYNPNDQPSEFTRRIKEILTHFALGVIMVLVLSVLVLYIKFCIDYLTSSDQNVIYSILLILGFGGIFGIIFYGLKELIDLI